MFVDKRLFFPLREGRCDLRQAATEAPRFSVLPSAPYRVKLR